MASVINAEITSNENNYGSGPENEHGLQLEIKFDPDTKTVFGEFDPQDRFEGDKGELHGGVVATILQEAMAKINQFMGIKAGNSELTVRYLQKIPTGEALHIRGWFLKKNKKIIENRAELENEMGKIVARAKGKFSEIIDPPPEEE
jgi:acyl-coenzyme A thioesterase PaaI-like protein